MKTFKIIALIVLAFFLAFIVAVAIFIKTLDVNKYLPQITQQASLALGRAVSIHRAQLAFSFKGVALDVGPMSIADAPQFSQKPFMTVEAVHFGLELMPLILKREIHITDVVVKSPQISIIRSKTGAINAQTIGQPVGNGGQINTASPQETSNASKPAPPSTAAKNAPAALPILSVKTITIQGASFSFVDENEQLPLNIQLSGMNGHVDNFSLTQPFNFTVDGCAYSPTPNVHAQGQATLNLAHASVLLTNLAVKTDLSQLNLEQIKGLTPVLAQIPLPQQMAGSLEASIANMEVGAAGLAHLQAKVALSGGVIKLKELLSPLTNMAADLELTVYNLNVNKFAFNIGAGLVSGNAYLKDYPQAQVFNGQMSVADVKVEDLIDQKLWPVELKGKLAGHMKFLGQGFTPQAFYQTFKGDGELAISDGVIERLNILKMVLGQFKSVSGLADSLDNLLTGTLKDKLGADHTVLEKAQAKFSMEDATFFIDEALAQTQIFDATAKGSVDYLLKTEINTMVRLTKDASAAVVEQIKEMEYLLDDEQRIAIGAQVSGIIPNLKYTPAVDVKKITQNAIVGEGSKQLQKVIEKNPEVGAILNAVFGKEKKSEEVPQEGSQDNSQENSDSSKDAAKKAIGSVLQNIFK